MANEDRTKLLRDLLEQENILEIQSLIAKGCPISALRAATANTAWRFVLTNSGRGISIAKLDDLSTEWTQALSGLKTAASRLRVQDMDDPGRTAEFQQVRVRTLVARIAENTQLAGIRINRHMRAGELSPPLKTAIDDCLKEHGFQWNGGDTVHEIWSEEHEARLRSAQAEFEARKQLAQNSKAGIDAAVL
ncbi:hypothetical protein [Rhizobium indigoferae]|uniref:Uncharacterized protein n=1 Tax=Rhizobium indigoferae TaxID=158891 RepID=A0ABZ0ZHI4_9HYPH|nr:hypothetical protein [Rhizobium indigoferae]NNU56126.1 hypothetical protein [Rhizobium indigoferae]WQN37753.1 hypothetical protein U5G49_002892 [Rhizobium indigoferae]GLR59352.1 hypothetical protein GCM10007919_40790 [Rhizobium indigoferae]